MKKSTNESPDDEAPKAPTYKPPLLWEMVSMEGGISLLIIFPLTVLYFLKMAYR